MGLRKVLGRVRLLLMSLLWARNNKLILPADTESRCRATSDPT